MQNHTNFRRTQTGSTLVISMIVLVVLMLLGVTAMMSSDTQYKLAGNLQFEDLALNSAESTISAAEGWLAVNGGPDYLTTYTGTGIYAANTLDPLTMAWTAGNSIQGADSYQRYIIQRQSLGNRLQGSGAGTGGRGSSGCNVVNTYTITARGSSSRGATRFVQSYYSVLSC